jgi:3-isopropylmalate/(R)-2-methylmalate dehydratase small subunit
MPDIHKVMRGKVWKFGDSVDTSQLARGGSQISANENMKENCLRALRPEFSQQVKAGDFLVAGKNFGCGSSRQTAVQALQACGIQAVLAESVARIYLRNSIALALLTFAVPGITDLAADGDELEIDYAGGVVRNLSSGDTLPVARFPKSVEQIYELGGISRVIVKKLAEQGITPD